MAIFTSALLGGAGLISLGSGFLASVSAIALNAAVGIGISLAAQALAGKGDVGPQTAGVRGAISVGGDVPRSIILGRTATAGSLVYAGTWGQDGKTPNAYLVQVIALADAPVQSLAKVFTNSVAGDLLMLEPHADGLGFPVSTYRVEGEDYQWVRFYDGSQTVADPYLVSRFGDHPTRPYGATRVGRGVAYVVVTSRVNNQLFSGFPKFKFELVGSRLYDISRDSSAGGTGAQRWADPTTWGGDGDHFPVVQAYNILRGIRVSGQWLYGLQTVSAPRLPAAHWIGEIGKCRATTPGIGGIAEPTFLSGIEIEVSTEIGKSLEALEMASIGRISEVGGVYKMRVGAPPEPVLTIDDGELLSTEDQSYALFPGLAETVNGVTASYPEPAEAWATKEAKPLFSAAFEAEDGGRRLLSDIPMAAVYRASQVQRIMKAAQEEARRARRETLSVGPEFQRLEAGDVILRTSARNGFSAKRFRVDGVGDKANLDVLLDVTEIDPADYSPPGTYVPPSFRPLDRVAPAASVIGGWQVEPATLDDAGGVPRRPSIRVRAAAGLDDVSRVWVQVKLAGAADDALVFDASSIPYAAPYTWILNGTFLPATGYQVRGREVPFGTRPTQWSGWLPVTTPNVLITDVSVELANVGQSIKGALGDLYGQIDDFFGRNGNPPQLREIAETLSMLGAIGEVQRRQIKVEVAGALAQIIEEARVRISGDEALAQLYTGLSATVGANLARLQTEETARADGDSALASSITALSATVGTNLARLQTEEVARADGDSALASSLTALSSEVDGVQASLSTEQTTRANADSALSSSITALSSEVDGVQADLITEQSARSSGDGALASSISGVSADLNGRFAQGLVQFEAASAPSGVTARYAVLLRANSGASFVQSGFFLDIYDAGGGSLASRMAINVDQFVVFSGSHVASPLVFEGGILKLINAKIAQAQIDNLLVGTSNISPGAVTDVQSAFNGSEATINNSGMSIIEWLSISHGEGGPTVLISLAAMVFQNGALPIIIDVYSVQDDATVMSITVHNTRPGDYPRFTPLSYMLRHTPPSGRSATRYEFRARIDGGGGGVEGYVKDRAFVLQALKR